MLAQLIFNNPFNPILEATPFVQRLRGKLWSHPSYTDHVHLKNEFFAIYTALEARLNRSAQEPFWEEIATSQWNNRTKMMRQTLVPTWDVENMAAAGQRLPATQQIVAAIQAADSLQLLAWFAMRALADSLDAEDSYGFVNRNQAFYAPIRGQQATLLSWLDSIALDDDQIQQFSAALNQAFGLHIQLMNELENLRPPADYSKLLRTALFVAGSLTTLGYLAVNRPERGPAI